MGAPALHPTGSRSPGLSRGHRPERLVECAQLVGSAGSGQSGRVHSSGTDRAHSSARWCVMRVEPLRLEWIEALIDGDAAFTERFGVAVIEGWAGFPEALPHALDAARRHDADPWGSISSSTTTAPSSASAGSRGRPSGERSRSATPSPRPSRPRPGHHGDTNADRLGP